MKKRHAVWLAVGALAIAAILALSMPASPVKATIGSDELAKLQASGAMVVDVRTPPEFEAGHIPSAVNVPVDQLPQGSATWDHDKPVVVYCATGARSADAAALLAGEGFKKVYDLDKGMVAWTGEVVGGPATASTPSGPGAVKTGGKPLFVQFSTST